MHTAVDTMFDTLAATYPGNAERTEISRWHQIAARAEEPGTMKAWMHDRAGQTVETFQYDARHATVWCPGPRIIDVSSRSTCVALNGSRRDYAGMHHLGSNSDTLIVGDDMHIIIYTTLDPSKPAGSGSGQSAE